MVIKMVALLLVLNCAWIIPQDIEETLLANMYRNLTPVALPSTTNWTNMPYNRKADNLTGNFMLKYLQRPIPPGYVENFDCVFSQRRLRPVPTACYDGWYSWTIEATWYQFVNEVINDLRFTYDFVLYNEEAELTLENMLWYNIGYLKELIIHVPNPADLVAPALALQRDYNEVSNKLSARLLSLSDKVSTLDRKLDDLIHLYSKTTSATDN